MAAPILHANRLETYTAFDKEGKQPLYIQDRYLQRTYRKPSPPEERLTNQRTITRTGTNGVRECRDIADVDKFDQSWGESWVIEYDLKKARTKGFYIGGALTALGAIALIATGVGAAAGAAWAVSASNLTVLSNFVLAGGTTALGIGIPAMGIPKGYKRGPQRGMGFYADFHRGELQNVGTELDRV